MAMSARQILQELGRRQVWLAAKRKEKKGAGENTLPLQREMEALAFAMRLVELKVEENAVKRQERASVMAASGLDWVAPKDFR